MLPGGVNFFAHCKDFRRKINSIAKKHGKPWNNNDLNQVTDQWFLLWVLIFAGSEKLVMTNLLFRDF